MEYSIKEISDFLKEYPLLTYAVGTTLFLAWGRLLDIYNEKKKNNISPSKNKNNLESRTKK